MVLQEVLLPVTMSEFLASSYQTTWLRVDGSSRNMRDVFSLGHLNVILNTLRTHLGRVRVITGGADVERYKFVRRERQPELGEMLDSRKTQALLQRGATLLLTRVDEVSLPIRDLVESIEVATGVPCQANLYCSTGTEGGFPLHWDSHDAYVIQLYGKKEWSIHRPTVECPLPGQMAESAAGEDISEQVWSGVLAEGDFLYMPRGWWHMARPVGCWSVHVTVGPSRLTGLDFLSWVLEQSRNPTLQRDVPVAVAPAAQAEYLQSLESALRGVRLGSVSAIEAFARQARSKAPPRPDFTFGDGAGSLESAQASGC